LVFNQSVNSVVAFYFYGLFSVEARFVPFAEAVQTTVAQLLLKQQEQVPAISAVLMVCQVLIVFFQICWLAFRASHLKRPLTLLTFCDPTVVLETPLAIQLLRQQGSRRGNSDKTDSSEHILAHIDRGCVLCDRSLVIEDSNDLFATMIGSSRISLRGRSFAEAVCSDAPEQKDVLDPLLSHIDAALKGKGPTVFDHGISLKLLNADHLVKFHVLCLGDRGTPMEVDAADITGIAFLMEDMTQEQMKLDAVKAEQDALTNMLSNVIPREVATQLEDGTDSVAFAVQSATIGFVRVKYHGDQFLQVEFADQVQFYDDVFGAFDRILTRYPLLARIRTIGNVYIFAGSVFGSVNKPEKHAEEATRFALKLITDVAEIEAEVGSGIELTIGLNTGGPLVAGVPAISRPTFQLIGPPFEIAEQLMKYGDPMHVHVTRSVYELVYAHNFRIRDCGEVKVDGNRMLPTYLIDL
jgi:class 3 adenylate cyclase